MSQCSTFTKKKQQKIGQDAIRRIIWKAFREFRDIELVDEKLKECVEIVCHDSYMLYPKEAAVRILDIVENMPDCELLEVSISIT